MSEWRKCNLSDVADVIDSMHQTPKYSALGKPLVRVTDLKNGYLSLNDCLRVSEEVYQTYSSRHKSQEGDIVFARVGSYGNLGFVNKPMDFCLGQNTAFIIPNEDARYLYYYLKSPLGQNEIEASVGGSTQPTVSIKSIKNFEILLPPLPEQKAIASVLSSLDDKIDLLHRQNKTLEAMAETLFRQWFIEEAKEDWEEVTLADVCTRITDGSHSSPVSVEDGYPMASVKDMYDWGINQSTCRKISKEDYEVLVQADCKALQGDILIAKDGSYLKHVFLMEESLDVVLLSSIAMLRPNGQYHPMLLTLFLKLDSTHELMQNIVTGAVIPRIVLKDFRKFPIQLPPKDLQDKAVKIVKPIFEKCWENNRQIQTLENLRDTLLPKLMSGEVSVQYQTEEVA